MTIEPEHVAVALTLAGMAAGGIVWATRLEGRVNLLQRWIDGHAQTQERLTRVEERLHEVRGVVDEIKEIIVKRVGP